MTKRRRQIGWAFVAPNLLGFGVFTKQTNDPGAGNRLIVDDDYADHLSHFRVRD